MSTKKEDKPIVATPTNPEIFRLTPEQKEALELWHTLDEEDIAAAVGVTTEVIQDWQKLTIFRLARINEENGIVAEMDELQAAALIIDKVTFADAEKALGFDPGTISEWAKDPASPFPTLLECMRSELREPERDEQRAKYEAEKKALKDQQMLAIPHILTGKTDTEVAEAVGVTRETINRWRNHDNDFMRELRQSRKAELDSHMITISNVNKKAVNVLEKLLDSHDEQIRMRAAIHLLKTVSVTHKK